MEFLRTHLGLLNTCFVVLVLVTMAACGPSGKERERIAAVTCAEIAETRTFESARRVKLINDAREKLGVKPMLRGDATIVIANLYGICDELVKSDEEFDAALEVATRPEREEQERSEEKQQKLVDWFNENYSLQVKSLHIVMRKRTDFESIYSFLGNVNYGFVGELEVECSSEERCDQLLSLGFIMADVSPGSESELIALLIGEQVTFRQANNPSTTRALCIEDFSAFKAYIGRESWPEYKEEAALMTSIMRARGFVFEEMDVGRCKFNPIAGYSTLYYRLKEGDVTLTSALRPQLSKEVASELSEIVDFENIGRRKDSWRGDDWMLEIDFARDAIPLSVTFSQ